MRLETNHRRRGRRRGVSGGGGNASSAAAPRAVFALFQVCAVAALLTPRAPALMHLRFGSSVISVGTKIVVEKIACNCYKLQICLDFVWMCVLTLRPARCLAESRGASQLYDQMGHMIIWII